MVRRDAIALLARIERRSATILSQRADSPAIKSSAEWVAVRLGEIEPFFLEKADQWSAPWRDNWLTAAERRLAFYVRSFGVWKTSAVSQTTPERGRDIDWAT